MSSDKGEEAGLVFKPMSDEEWNVLMARCRRALRGMLLIGFSLLALLLAGASALKAAAVACAMLMLYLANIGARAIERLGFAAFLLLAIWWVELVPLQRWISGAYVAIDRMLG